MSVSAPISMLYGAVTQSWMFYCVMPLALSGWAIAQPAVQGLLSRSVPVNEQRLLQGAVSSFTSLTSIAGPPIWTGLFGYFVRAAAPMKISGTAFFVSDAVFLAAPFLAIVWQIGTVGGAVPAWPS